MTASQAQIRANSKYNKKAYDDIKVRVKKGERAELQAIAEKQGMSLNAFITAAISSYIKTLNG